MTSEHRLPEAAHEMVWIDAATLDELWEGEVAGVELAGEPVLLVHLPGGELRAYQGLCPHQEVPLEGGDWDPDRGVLMCSGHLWEFDLRTGVGVNPEGYQLDAYPVVTDGDVVRVGVPHDRLRHDHRGAGTWRERL